MTFLDILQVVVLIYSVVLHELAHGLAARAMGDRTAEQLGRLTLNPLKHVDTFGSFFLPLLLIIAHSPFVFGYAKPVPYNPYNLSDRKYGAAKVAVAGPLTNLVLAALFGTLLRFFGDSLSPVAGELIAGAVLINLALAIFNLMPIPPLDGHWLAMTFLPASFNGLKVAMYRYQWVLFIAVIFFVFPALWPVLQWLFELFTGSAASF